MNEEVYLSMSGSIHHLLSVEGLCASREKSLWWQNRASMNSVTGCGGVRSSDHMTHLISYKTLLVCICAVIQGY